MLKKILTILLAMVMTLIPITGGATTAAVAATDGQLLNISFTKNADTIVTPEAVEGVNQATINPDTWFGGIQDLYGSDFLDQGFGGFPQSKFTDAGFTFKEKVYDATSSKLITDFDGAKTYNIPYAVPEGELDSFIFSNLSETTTSLTIDLEETYSTSVFLAMNMRADFSITPKIKYKGEEEVQMSNIRCIGYPQYGADQKDRFDNVNTTTVDDVVYISEKTNDLDVRIAGDISWSGIKLYMTDLATTDSETGETVKDTVASETSNGRTTGLILYELRLDSTKIPETLTISSATKYPAVLYTVSQQEITNAELMEAITEAEAVPLGALTEEQLALIEKANENADILEERNYDYDFTYIRKLAEYTVAQAKFADIVNIPFTKNADTLITAETVNNVSQATIDPDTWFAGLLDNYSVGFFESGFSGGLMSVVNSKTADGYMTFDEKVYDTASASLKTGFNGAKTYNIPFEQLEEGELDSFILSASVPYGKEEAPKTLEVKLNEIPASSVYMITNRRGAAKIKAVVKYSDDSTDEYEIISTQSGAAGNYTAMYEQVAIAEDGTVTREAGRSSRAAGVFEGLGYASYTTTKITDEGVRDTTAEQIGNQTRNLILLEIKTDSTKLPVSVTFTNNEIYPMAIYSIAQDQLSVDEMKAVLDAAAALNFTDEDFSEKATQAINYKQLLVDNGFIAEGEYSYVDDFGVQLVAEAHNYIELKDYVDTDLMVLSGSTAPAKGRTVPEAQQNADHNYNTYYNASKLPADGIVEMLAPTNEIFANVNNGEAGWTFKLSGGFDGEGADAVKVAGNSSKTITLSDKLEGTRKALGVILDSVYVGESLSPSGEGVTAETSMHGYMNVKVTLAYADGDTEDKYTRAYLATGYYHPSIYSHSSGYGRLYNNNGVMTETSNNQYRMYASGIEYNPAKELESITFVNSTGNEYHILAITELAYTNAELNYTSLSALDSATAETAVSFASKDALIAEAKIALESNRRGIKALSAEELERISAILSNASEFESATYGKVFSKHTISDGTAAVTLANTTVDGKYYSIILAAYDTDGRLCDINASESKVLKAGECDTVASVSVAAAAAAEYKVFIWTAADTLKPLATTEYPY